MKERMVTCDDCEWTGKEGQLRCSTEDAESNKPTWKTLFDRCPKCDSTATRLAVTGPAVEATVRLHSSKEYMWAAGNVAGLTGKALNAFMHALSEVTLALEVDSKTGLAKIKSVDGKRLEDE